MRLSAIPRRHAQKGGDDLIVPISVPIGASPDVACSIPVPRNSQIHYSSRPISGRGALACFGSLGVNFWAFLLDGRTRQGDRGELRQTMTLSAGGMETQY